jgi:septal ring factor EnvC (AmiA/AmiB activator)
VLAIPGNLAYAVAYVTKERVVNMDKTAAATKGDIDDILNVLNTMMGRIDERFVRVEDRLDKIEIRLDQVELRLDRVEARLDSIEGEQCATTNQLTRLNDWAEYAGKRLGVPFAH